MVKTLNTKTIFNLVRMEEVAFWISMMSVVAMCALFITGHAKVMFDLKFLTITSAGLFGLNAAFFYGLHASLKGRPGYGMTRHLLLPLFMLVSCLILYIIAFWFFDVVTSAFTE